MKKILFLTVLLSATSVFAEDGKNDWHDTVLSEATIKKIQSAQYQYKKCVVAEMQKSEYEKQDSRRATETIIKKCEPELAKMRETYLAEKVPEVVADRHLKQMRMKTTRDALQTLIFNEAARKAGQ